MPSKIIKCNEPEDCFVCPYQDCINNGPVKLSISDYIDEVSPRKPAQIFKGVITCKNIKTSEIQTFKSIRDCASYFGYCESSISYRLQHPNRQYEGWTFNREA